MHFKNLIIPSIFLFLSFSVFAEETIGEKDASMESHLLFLRDTTVLLQKGNQRIGALFTITNNEQKVLTTSVSQRVFSSTFSYSFGVGGGVEIFSSLPINYTKTKQYDFLFESDKQESYSGLANIVLGAKKTLIRQGVDIPEIVGSFSFAKALNDKYVKYNSSTVNLTAIKSVDPVVLYGGVSFTRLFGGGEKNTYGFRFGSAFAVNHKIAFGGEISINEISSDKSTLVPISTLTLRETYTVNKNFSIEPSISFGLSENSSDSAFGISFSRSL